jgi:RNA polymerase sigma factor (sigma-70 family)
MADPHVELVRRALRGQESAVREVIDLIGPQIQVSVARTLQRRIAASARSRAQHEVEDLTQEVLLALFARDGKRLRAWDPEKGLALPAYVKLVARHLVLSFLRKRERRVWEDEPVDETAPPEAGEEPESLVARRELYQAVLAAVEADLTPQGRDLLRLLVVEGRAVPEVCAATGLTPNAVHIWRSRLAKAAGEAARRISRGEPADE